MNPSPIRLLTPAVLALALAACGANDSAPDDTVAAEADRAAVTAPLTPTATDPAAAADAGAGATATLQPTEGNPTAGELRFAAAGDRIEVTGTVTGLTGGGTHGFHVHETGDCSAPDATSAGGHFNPTGQPHGRAGEGEHHVGDSDNITADADGTAQVQGWLAGATLGDGAGSDIVGKAVIVHAGEDDYATQPTGDAGGRLACGVIEAN